MIKLCWLLFIGHVALAEVDSKSLAWYQPKKETTLHLQLNGKLNLYRDVDLYIVDLFDTKVSDIKALQERGKKVIAYFSAGSFEAWREDAKKFKSTDVGKKMDGWDEKWLDIRSASVRAIMIARLDEAKRKGFDGVDADNVNGYTNHTGFNLSAQEQLDFNIFLANESHKRALTISLKNDIDQSTVLVPYFDFLLNEECATYDECEKCMPFIKAGKPVFHIEYDVSKKDKFCAEGKNRGFQALILPLELDDSFRYGCQ